MRRLVGLLIVMALILSAGGMQLTSQTGPTAPTPTQQVTAKTTSTSTSTTTSGSSGNSSSGSTPGSNVVCSQNGLRGVSVTDAGGVLHISYHGSTVGAGEASILAAWSAYKNCVTTAPTLSSISCSVIHSVGRYTSVCSISLKIKPTAWNSTHPSAPSSKITSTTQSETAACRASLNPSVQRGTASATSASFLPSAKWLLNLPVEYTYAKTAAPSLSLRNASKTCAINIASTAADGFQGASGQASVTASGFHVVSVAPDTQVELIDAVTGQVVFSTTACTNPMPLIPLSKLPNYQGNLAGYANFFSSKGVCTLTPTGAAYQAAAVAKQPVYFRINRAWVYRYSYSLTGTSTVTYSMQGHKLPSTTSTTNFGTTTKTTVVGAPTYTSAPIKIDYVTGVECSVVAGKISCPSTGSAG